MRLTKCKTNPLREKHVTLYGERMQLYYNAGWHFKEGQKKLAVVLRSWARTINSTLVHLPKIKWQQTPAG